MAKILLDFKKFANYAFNGCEECDAKCCASSIIYASLYDLDIVSKYFPILFYVKDKKISPVYFFYYGESKGDKCPYLKNNLCTIYDDRPYACRSYPFSLNSEKAYFDDGCPQVSPARNSAKKLFGQNGSLNSYILDNFVTPKFNNQNRDNEQRTTEFINFCLKENFLAPYSDFFTNNEIAKNFKPSIMDKLYTVHPQRIAVMRMKNCNIFANNPEYLNYIVLIIKSISNIQKLFDMRQNTG